MGRGSGLGCAWQRASRGPGLAAPARGWVARAVEEARAGEGNEASTFGAEVGRRPGATVGQQFGVTVGRRSGWARERQLCARNDSITRGRIGCQMFVR